MIHTYNGSIKYGMTVACTGDVAVYKVTMGRGIIKAKTANGEVLISQAWPPWKPVPERAQDCPLCEEHRMANFVIDEIKFQNLYSMER